MPGVLIATNQPILAKGFEVVLTAGGLEIAGICADVFEISESVRLRRPCVMILDMSILPQRDAIRDLRRLAPNCRIIPWPCPGLSGSPARLVEAVNMMVAFSEIGCSSPASLVDAVCTAGEREVVNLAGYGLTVDEIAIAMRSNRAAVKRLLSAASDRLGAKDRIDLALFGLAELTSPNGIEGRPVTWTDEIEPVFR